MHEHFRRRSSLRFYPSRPFRNKLLNYFNQRSPKMCYILFRAKEDEFLATRRLLAIPFGVLASLILFKYVIGNLILLQTVLDIVFPFSLLLMTFFYSISLQFRTLTWLLIPFTFSYLGRSYLYLLYFYFLTQGPGHSVVHNSIVASQTLTCSLVFHYNLTSTRMKLSLEPIQHVMVAMFKAHNAHQSKLDWRAKPHAKFAKELNNEDLLSQLRSETARIDKLLYFKRDRVKEIEDRYSEAASRDPSPGKRAAKYQRLNEYSCESVFNQAVEKCFNLYEEVLKKCSKRFTQYLCDSANQAKESCSKFVDDDMTRVGSSPSSKKVCDQNLVPEFSEQEHELEKKFGWVMGDEDIRLRYHVPKPELISPKDLLEKVRVYLDYTEELLAFSQNFLKILSHLIFVLTLYFANCYHNNYLRRINFDNKYITYYFRHVDNRRELAKRSHLLPLRYLEKLELFDSQSIKLTDEEKSYRNSSLRTFIPVAIASLILCVFDRFLLDVLSRTKSEYLQIKEVNTTSKLFIQITGNGTVAQRMMNLIPTTNIYKNQIFTITNKECLPNPITTHSITYKTLVGLFTAILVYICIQPYMLRLRHVICGFFYPRREKKRILYLYNDRLRKRKQYDQFQIERLRASIQQNVFRREINLIRILAYKFPGLQFLRKYVQIPCTICQEAVAEGRLKCHRCLLRFCRKCWELCNQRCPACHPIM